MIKKALLVTLTLAVTNLFAATIKCTSDNFNSEKSNGQSLTIELINAKVISIEKKPASLRDLAARSWVWGMIRFLKSDWERSLSVLVI